MARTFDDQPAVRRQMPVNVALIGCSGSGKTNSALELATGMQRVINSEIFFLDTESGRSCQYAPKQGEKANPSGPAPTYDFRRVDFKAPFGPLDYLAAIEHCVKQGAKIVVVDSQSHEHEGPGGVLEQHESELDRIAGKTDYAKRERSKMLAWSAPKQARRRLLNTMVQLDVSFILCFRAKEKVMMVKSQAQFDHIKDGLGLREESGKKPIEMGWQLIGGEEFAYEMMTCLLLPPGANGVPDLSPVMPGERQMVKVPAQFRGILKPGMALSAAIGEEMARWAAGGAPRVDDPPQGKGVSLPDDRPALLDQILAILKEDFPGRSESERVGRATLLNGAFGSPRWPVIEELPVDALRAGLAKMQPASLREREPGEDGE